MVKKLLLGSLGVVVMSGLGVVGYVLFAWDRTYDVPLPALEASTDPAVIARGEYLVQGPAHCGGCHVGSFDELHRVEAGEQLPLRGGLVFTLPPLGSLSPPNLTPDGETGIGRYSDGQVFRMLRHAIRPNGTATLSLMMPFWNMAEEDHVAIVSYLRSIPAVRNETPGSRWTFVGKMIRTFAPPFQSVLDPKPPAKAPAEAPTRERGEYLARAVANCFACHTEHDMATFEQVGAPFAGGMEFEPMPGFTQDPALWFRSPNLTSHETGVLKNYPTAQAWIARFRAGRTHPDSPMDWGPFSHMSDADLEALWVFLRSLPPVDHAVGQTIFRKEG